jgi:transcriptional regulator with XRE-family HTH domain
MQARIVHEVLAPLELHAKTYDPRPMRIAGDRLKERRVKLGLSQARVAELAGMSQVNVSRAERGEIQRGFEGTLEGLARALNCSAAYLRGEADEPGDERDAPSGAGGPTGTTNGARQNWVALREAAKAIDPTLPDWTLDQLETSPSMTTYSIQPTPMAVVELARVVQRHGQPPRG